ncbi:MAG TPA: hypothetical protein ENH90_01195 [bacterium]|nr:hypothetical protein [bacterium]
MDEMINTLFGNPWFIPLIVFWTIPWKGVALWKASKNNHKKWFVVLLFLNTLAVLEIIYIFFFSKNKQAAANREN